MKHITLSAVLAAGVLAGCQNGSLAPLVFNAKVADSALAASYNNLTSFGGFEAAATTIRNSVVFQAQNFIWPGTTIAHNSLDNANVEYAHAVGLTGAGQTISIVDTGFRLTHDELASKTITLPATYPPGLDNHGTAVAAIAAADGSSGQMIGVAPGADLQLGSFGSLASMTEATNQAIAIGAIVQNNSWGYSVPATSANYNSVFGSASGQTYIDALRNFAAGGVIVFAASNDVGQTQIDLVAGLPNLVPELETSFIAAINGVPSRDGSGQINGATLFSSPCLEAARYCMIADGTIKSATGTGDSDYMLWSGTSFAAPQISGAVAILAEAFPTLSAQELRARILASANNGWFTQTGVVNFSDTVQHGFSDVYGHGFLDLAAALLPIGSSYVPVSASRSVPLGTPLIMSRGAAGNALTSGLARYQMVFADGLSSQFDISAAALSVHGASFQNPVAFAAERVARAGEVPVLSAGFGAYTPGRRTAGAVGGGELTVLIPDAAAASETFGANWRGPARGGLSFGLTGLVERGSMLGTALGGDIGAVNTVQGAASVELVRGLAPGLSLALGGRLGLAVPANGSETVRFEPAAFDEFGARIAATGLARAGDRLSLRLGLPPAVAAGGARVRLPVALSAGTARFDSVAVSMVPQARQVDLGLDYARPVGRGGELVFSAAGSVNAGHVAGQSDTAVAIGWKLNF